MLYFSRWKSALIWLAVLVSFIIASPNFFSRETLAKLPGFLPKQQIALGLDLSGGSRLVAIRFGLKFLASTTRSF